MKLQWMGIALIAVVAVALAAAFSPQPGTAPERTWKPVEQTGKPAPRTGVYAATLADAEAESQRTGKPVMIIFHAEWCGACKYLEANALHDAGVLNELKRWVPVRVDSDREPQIAARHNVTGLPTIIFYRAAGGPTARFSGAGDAATMIGVFRKAYDQVVVAPVKS